MFKIVAVCSCGIGTSAFSRGLIMKTLEEMNYDMSDIKVECTEVLGIKGVRADVLVTTEAMLSKMPEVGQNGVRAVIGLTSLVKDKEGLIEKITPTLQQAEAEGIIHKLNK